MKLLSMFGIALCLTASAIVASECYKPGPLTPVFDSSRPRPYLRLTDEYGSEASITVKTISANCVELASLPEGRHPPLFGTQAIVADEPLELVFVGNAWTIDLMISAAEPTVEAARVSIECWTRDDRWQLTNTPPKALSPETIQYLSLYVPMSSRLPDYTPAPFVRCNLYPGEEGVLVNLLHPEPTELAGDGPRNTGP